jgi:HPt (histidine-containing phosphotransfer) domain-containing protein
MNLDVLYHKLKVKIGKATSTETPFEYKTLRDVVSKMDGVPPKVYKALTKFCQKFEKACKAQQVLGETLSTLALEEIDTDVGEIMLKTGEAIKSLSIIQHAMLVNHIDKVVKPLQKLEVRIKQAKDLDSAYSTKHHEYDSCINRLETMADTV